MSCFPLHFFRALPLPACFTTEQSTVEASLFVKYTAVSKKVVSQKRKSVTTMPSGIMAVYSYKRILDSLPVDIHTDRQKDRKTEETTGRQANIQQTSRQTDVRVYRRIDGRTCRRKGGRTVGERWLSPPFGDFHGATYLLVRAYLIESQTNRGQEKELHWASEENTYSGTSRPRILRWLWATVFLWRRHSFIHPVSSWLN